MKEQNVDKKLDELLDEAIPIYLKRKDVPKNEEISFSEEHEKNMQKIFESVDKKEKVHETIKIMCKVAAVFICAIVILGMTEPSNSAWKFKITEFFVKEEKESEYSWVVYGDSGDSYELNFNVQKDKDKTYKITFLDYLPDGYTLKVNVDNKRIKYFKLKNDNKEISVKISKEVNLKTLDTENADSENIVFNGINMSHFAKEETCSYAWFKDDYLFRFYGKNIEHEEMTKIIENINYDEIEKVF